jgi:DNA-binding SARP family transcriptional activator/DNA-binding XRE family transcriptional regulator
MTHEGAEPGSRFGALVRAYRRKAGLTQQELAMKAGLSVGALRDIEQSRRQRPRLNSVIALANALGLDSERAASMVDAGRDAMSSQLPRRSGLARNAGPMGTGQGLRLAILGPLEAWRDGRPLSLGPPARRAVLGLLAMGPGMPVRRDTIIDVLWREEPPRTAMDLVQSHVSRLRRVLEPPEYSAAGDGGQEVISSARGAYRLRVSFEQVDLLLFKDLAARATAAQARGDDGDACKLYEDAARLWRGDPLADVDLLSGHPGITLLRYQLTSVLLRYAELACALGQSRSVLPMLQALAVSEPLNESVHARLMIALAGTGQQATAIGVYEDLRTRLDRELGLYPSKELGEAHLRVLRQDIRAEGNGRHPDRAPPAAIARAVPRQLPAAPQHFSGRRGETDMLSSLLDRDSGESTGVVAALTGRAGSGKTALAIYWAHQVTDRFPDGQLYVDLHGASPSSALVSPSEAISGFLTALGVPAARFPAGAADQVAVYHSLLADRQMLIVLDNARDAEQARSLLPGSPGCFVLVTSRDRLIGLAAAEGAHLLPLAALDTGVRSVLDPPVP